MSEEKNQRLKEYPKILIQKSLNIIINKISCNCNFNSYSNKIVF